MAVTTLAPWFGSNRMLAHRVGEALDGCSWVGVVFAGGMSELPYIGARTILVNDKHKHVINLARVTRDNSLRPQLIRRAARRLFHPDELKEAQQFCLATEPQGYADLDAAEKYFVACWMGRSSKAGLVDEFNGRPSVRWKSDGGDSMVRYRSALRMLGTFSRTAKRCTFEDMDAFDFLKRCEDLKKHGVYCDAPFVGAGRRYRHNSGDTDAEERAWHTRLRDELERFTKARVVCRFYDHPLIRELYSTEKWTWLFLEGRKQTNEAATEEVLLINRIGETGSLFA